jgi:uncharacterized protein DUF2834
MFLALAFVGLVAQLGIAAAFVADFGSMMTALAYADLIASAVVFVVWMPREARRVGIERWWPFALATLGGLCFAFPLFLHAREKRLR